MTIQPVDNLVYDISCILYRTYHASKSHNFRGNASALDDDDEELSPEETADQLARFALHKALISLNKYFQLFKPTRVVACFDRPNNWRKQYVESGLAITNKPYKGNRRQNQTPAQRAQYESFIEHVNQFEELLRDETGILTLSAPGLEADDCISGWVQQHSHQRNIIATLDSDMSQLITDTTSVCNLNTGELVDCPDPGYFLFEKIFRGDTADNIANIYPGIRATKLQKAYTDPYVYANLMAEPHIPVGEKIVENPADEPQPKYTVKDAFEENQLLMDLTKQPPHIRKKMERIISEEINKTKRFNFWKFSAFCRQTKLVEIEKNLSTFRPLLIGGYHSVR